MWCPWGLLPSVQQTSVRYHLLSYIGRFQFSGGRGSGLGCSSAECDSMALGYINREERLKIVWGSPKGISEQRGLARCIGLYHIEKGQAKQRY